MEWLVIGSVVAVCLYMAWAIGANDVANSMADAVGSRALSLKWAIILAAGCEFAGAVLVGSDVTDTIRKGIVRPEALAGRPEELCLGMACAALAAALWLHLATAFGMPVSTTHSIVGAVAGLGIVAAGWASVHWGRIGGIVASWFISPIAGMAMAFAVFHLISHLVLRRARPAAAAVWAMPVLVFIVFLVVALSTLYDGLKNLAAEWRVYLVGPRAMLLSTAIALIAAALASLLIRRSLRGAAELPLGEQLHSVERVFAPLVIITSSSVAFAHGANDVANAVGPMAAVFHVIKTGSIAMKVPVPIWILALGGAGIVLGLSTYGYRVMRTVGSTITELTPSRGVAADIAASTTVLVCSRLGMPISTTHTIVGAILGVGLARGLAAVNYRIIRNILGSWLITVPAAAMVTVLLFLLGRALGADTLFAQIMPVAPSAP